MARNDLMKYKGVVYVGKSGCSEWDSETYVDLTAKTYAAMSREMYQNTRDIAKDEHQLDEFDYEWIVHGRKENDDSFNVVYIGASANGDPKHVLGNSIEIHLPGSDEYESLLEDVMAAEEKSSR